MAGESTQGADGRRVEADRILELIGDLTEGMNNAERTFVMGIENGPVTVKQLYWLRDIKDKYL